MLSGVYSQISNEFAFPTVKDRWDQLKWLYSGATGSTTVLNNWIMLTQAHLDENQPLGPHLTKLNEAQVNLANMKMGVSDIQYCFILLCTLPDSYEMLTFTILDLGNPKNLHPGNIVTYIQNEEGHRNGGFASLNAIALIKGKGNGKASSIKKEKHANLTCHYCNKKGHIKPDCQKRKKDEADRKKKDKESRSSAKAINSHVVETTASIQEVNDIGVSLCTVTKSHW